MSWYDDIVFEWLNDVDDMVIECILCECVCRVVVVMDVVVFFVDMVEVVGGMVMDDSFVMSGVDLVFIVVV